MLTYALLPTAPEAEPELLRSSSQSAAITVTQQAAVQAAPANPQREAGTERGQAYLQYDDALNEKKTGTGNIKWPDKRFYKGSIVAGLHHGKGHMLFPEGRRYYVQFSNGTMNGLSLIHNCRCRRAI